MKYLIIREDWGLEFPVFCLAPQTHAELATAWRRNDTRRVVSAGFVEFAPGGPRTFGRSASLDLGPREQDARLIAAFYRATLTSTGCVAEPDTPAAPGRNAQPSTLDTQRPGPDEPKRS